jgi:hypothetical protein
MSEQQKKAWVKHGWNPKPAPDLMGRLFHNNHLLTEAVTVMAEAIAEHSGDLSEALTKARDLMREMDTLVEGEDA